MDITIVNVDRTDHTWSFEKPNWAEQFPLIMGDTYRYGGVSKKPCESLNLATHIGDRLQDVLENRSIVADYLGVSSNRITCGNQVHGLKVVRITEELIGAGALSPDTAIPDCDAVYTDIPNVPLFLCGGYRSCRMAWRYRASTGYHHRGDATGFWYSF